MFQAPIKDKEFIIVPTVDTSAYAVADAIDVKHIMAGVFLSNGSAARITKVVIIDNAKQHLAIDLMFFNGSITSATDNAAFNPSNSDAAKAIGTISIVAGDYVTIANQSIATKNIDPELEVMSHNSNDLYVQLVARGTPTYASASDLTVKIYVRQK